MSRRGPGWPPLAVAALGLAQAVLGACAEDRCNGATADAVYVRVTSADTGEPVDAEVLAERDGEPADVECIETERRTDICLLWAVGYMEVGTFVLTVSAPGHEPVTDTVEVALGPCGPESQTRTYTLTALAGP